MKSTRNPRLIVNGSKDILEEFWNNQPCFRGILRGIVEKMTMIPGKSLKVLRIICHGSQKILEESNKN